MLRMSHIQSKSPILMNSVLSPGPSRQPTIGVPLARLHA
jgi:hypothetical protein